MLESPETQRSIGRVAWAMASTLPAEYLGMAPRGESHVVWSDDASEVTHVAFRPDTIG